MVFRFRFPFSLSLSKGGFDRLSPNGIHSQLQYSRVGLSTSSFCCKSGVVAIWGM